MADSDSRIRKNALFPATTWSYRNGRAERNEVSQAASGCHELVERILALLRYESAWAVVWDDSSAVGNQWVLPWVFASPDTVFGWLAEIDSLSGVGALDVFSFGIRIENGWPVVSQNTAPGAAWLSESHQRSVRSMLSRLRSDCFYLGLQVLAWPNGQKAALEVTRAGEKISKFENDEYAAFFEQSMRVRDAEYDALKIEGDPDTGELPSYRREDHVVDFGAVVACLDLPPARDPEAVRKRLMKYADLVNKGGELRIGGVRKSSRSPDEIS